MKLYAIFDKDGNCDSLTYSDEQMGWITKWFVSGMNEDFETYKARMESEGYTCEEVEVRRVQK